MCLFRVKRERRLKKPLRVYKAVHLRHDGNIVTPNRGFFLRMGLNTALPTSTLLTSTRGQDYSAGFHCFRRKRDCKQYGFPTTAVCTIPAGTLITTGVEISYAQVSVQEVVVTPLLVVDYVEGRPL